MKIVHFIYDNPRNPWVGGGGAIRVHEINRRLAARHDVLVMCGKYPGAVDCEVEGLRYKFMGSDEDSYIKSTFGYALSARKQLHELAHGADVVVEDFAPWNPIGAHRALAPSVIQLQNYLGREILKKYGPLGAPFWWLEQSYPKKFRHAIVLVQEQAARFGLDANKVEVISQGYDPEYITAPVTEGQYYLYLGRLDVHQKGLDILAKALRMLPDVPVLVVGGNDRRRFSQIFAGCQNVQYRDFVSGRQKYECIMNSCGLLLPSRFEGQGIVALEAAAFAKPVIASDIPELNYINAGGFGLMFPSEDVAALAARISELESDAALRERLGGRAREYAKDYTWDAVTQKYENYLMGVAREGVNP